MDSSSSSVSEGYAHAPELVLKPSFIQGSRTGCDAVGIFNPLKESSMSFSARTTRIIAASIMSFAASAAVASADPVVKRATQAQSNIAATHNKTADAIVANIRG